MKRIFLRGFLPFLLIFASQGLFAQSLEDVEPAPAKVNRIKQLKIKSLSDLQALTPYESVAVIQKRYLPKTLRGELNISVFSVINNTFFYLGGVSARAGFFLREDHGFGLEGFGLLPPINKIVTKEMIGPPNHILPYTTVISQFYGGAYYKWSPVFGKFAVLNNKIIYFDMYISLGAGMSHVVDGLDDETQQLLDEGSALRKLSKTFFPTGSVSVGQVFAFNQEWAFNWELKWLYTVIQYQDGDPYTPVDIGFSLGVNYYFPEAGYR